MDEVATLSEKKRGRPKGRKDGPRRENAPKRGRPKKKIENNGENENPNAVIHGACAVSDIPAVILRFPFTAEQDEYAGLWKDNDFTTNVLNEIFELEELAVQSSRGTCEFPPYLQRWNYVLNFFYSIFIYSYTTRASSGHSTAGHNPSATTCC